MYLLMLGTGPTLDYRKHVYRYDCNIVDWYVNLNTNNSIHVAIKK